MDDPTIPQLNKSGYPIDNRYNSKIRVGLIYPNRIKLKEDNQENFEFNCFTLGQNTLSYWTIFDSAFATPSRYIQEICQRLFKLSSNIETNSKLIFNPLFEVNSLVIAQVLNILKTWVPSEEICILTDSDDLPAGYLFPSWFVADDSRFLSQLSAVSGKIDAQLCRQLFRRNTRCISIRHLHLRRLQHQGFIYGENLAIYRWIAERASAVLDQLNKLPASEAEKQRNAIPITAIMPHHAGDALFFSLAWISGQTPASRMAVNRAYCDIIQDVAPDLTLIPIDLPLPNRDENFQRGKVTSEQDYFWTFADQLPTSSFYYYCRPSRDYNLSSFHLIDHFSFALGQQLYHVQSLPSRQPRQPKFSYKIPLNPIRILLHFDAGWPLKIYPREYQEYLINRLYERGYQLTVLAATAYEHPLCQVTTFHGYTQLKELITSHHITVGMDSFPCHCATHILGLPTICLFASTRPENANAPAAHNYVALENGMSCRPCYGIARCPIYGGPNCRNFVSPKIVINTIDTLLASLRLDQYQPVAKVGRTPVQPYQPSPENHKEGKLVQISLKYLTVRAMLTWIALPPLRYLFLLRREFIAVYRLEGINSALLRTFRFLRKTIIGRP